MTNLSNRLGEMGRREDALAAGSKAIDIRRELAARWPDAHHHELEQSLRVAALLKHGEDLSDASPWWPGSDSGPLSDERGESVNGDLGPLAGNSTPTW